MSSYLNTMDSLSGIQAEDSILEYLAKRFKKEGRTWVLVHSVCSDEIGGRAKLPNVITWIESAKKNSQLGDIRIFNGDIHGRPLRDKCVYVDVKYSKKWDYASVTFRRTGTDAKSDAIRHLCGFVGSGISPDDFWYLALGKKGTYIFTLRDVQNFIKNTSEEELNEICQLGKFNDVDTWFMPFDRIVSTCMTYDLDTWIEQVVEPRLD